MSIKNQYDIAIVGGGLVGLSFARALAGTDYSLAMIDARVPSVMQDQGFDNRAIALSLASQQIFTGYQLWDELAPLACPIEHIHISDQGRFGTTRLNAAEHDVPAFGYVVEIHRLANVLNQADPNLTYYAPVDVTACQNNQLTLSTGEIIKADLIIAADGANSALRDFCGIKTDKADYRQSTIVCNTAQSEPHQGWAYERFTPKGPLAMLPRKTHESTIIWTFPPEEINIMLGLSDAEFLDQLQQAFGYRAGQFTQLGKRIAYPLSMTLAKEIIQPGIVWVGNAAHAIHPIAGQGFNLGLRDIACLARLILSHHDKLTDFKLLEAYKKLRQTDLARMTQFTDFLARFFTCNHIPWRGLPLFALDNLPPLKQSLVEHAMGMRSLA